MGLPRQSSLIAVVLVALAWHACRLTAARPTPYSLTTREGAASSRNTHSEHVHGARAGQYLRLQEPRPEAFDTIRTRGLLQQQPQSLSPTQPEGGAAALAASTVSGLAGLLSLPVLPPLPETVNIPGVFHMQRNSSTGESTIVVGPRRAPWVTVQTLASPTAAATTTTTVTSTGPTSAVGSSSVASSSSSSSSSSRWAGLSREVEMAAGTGQATVGNITVVSVLPPAPVPQPTQPSLRSTQPVVGAATPSAPASASAAVAAMSNAVQGPTVGKVTVGPQGGIFTMSSSGNASTFSVLRGALQVQSASGP